jgi:hypothetical protein
MSSIVCTHLDQIAVRELPASVEGCEDCLRMGGKWLHLRICLTCGHVGCCDDSPNRHATAHAHATSHPIIRSLEPGEDWSWCYVDEVAFVVDGIRGETRIPASPLLHQTLRSTGCSRGRTLVSSIASHVDNRRPARFAVRRSSPRPGLRTAPARRLQPA